MIADAAMDSPIAAACTHVTHDSKAEAAEMKRKTERSIGGRFAIVRCPVCERWCYTLGGYFDPIKKEIVRQLALGFVASEIAADLDMTTSAVHLQVNRLVRDVNANSRTHLVALAMYFGIVDISITPPKEEIAHATYTRLVRSVGRNRADLQRRGSQ